MKRLVLLFLLVACGPTQPQINGQPILPTEEQDTCGARTYANLIGQPTTALEKVLILGRVRLIRPMTAVTMDFVSERINFGIDGSETIKSITCG